MRNMQNNSNIKVIISGGGTGGHIFPAIAIADTLKNNYNDVAILFVGAKHKMEMIKVPEAGYPIEGLWISGLQRRLTWKNFLVPIKMISSLLKANKIINKFKPDVVIGVGGYASWAVVKVASIKKIPTLIQEQNSFPGKSNINLSKKVNKICVAFEGMEKYFPSSKIVITGNPVRKKVIDIENKREEALRFFGLNPNKKTILAIGGSLGARTINQSIAKYLELLIKHNAQLIWQTGKTYYPFAIDMVKKFPNSNLMVLDFINRMDYAYAAADIIISRAGAISVSELCMVGKPVILVPSPNVAEDHQTKNAMSLVQSNAAILIKDVDCINVLGNEVEELLRNPEKCEDLSINIKKLALPNAAERIVEEIIKIKK